MSYPEEASASKPAQEGFWFLWAVLSCLSGPGGLSCFVLYCPVCLAPEGSWYPLTSPGKFFGGVEGFRLWGPGRGDRGHGHKDPPAMTSWAPCTAMASWAPSYAMASRAPSSAMASVICSALEVSVLCSCPCLSWGASRAPTPPPRWNCYGVGHAFREGGVMSGFCCVSCVPASCVHIWFVSCPRLMSLWVNSCPAVFVSLSVINLCILSSCLFSLISSGLLVTPRCFLSMSALPCLALPCPDVFIKDYYLSFSPRLRVPVPPSCVHRDSGQCVLEKNIYFIVIFSPILNSYYPMKG